MNPKKLDHFLKVAQAGSVSRAADRMQMSQPTLSREIRELETELGVVLLSRHSRGVGLTAAGEALKHRAELVLNLLETLRDEVGAASDEPSGRVGIGLPTSMTGSLSTPLLTEYRARYPLVRISLREAPSNQLRSLLMQRELDFAILSAPVSEPQLVLRPLITEPFVLVGPAGCPLTSRRQLTIDEVVDYPLIVPVRPNATRTLIDTAVERTGRVPKIVLETDAWPAADYISAGIGYAVLPASSAVSTHMVAAGVVSVPIKGMSITRLLATPAGASMSLATHKMILMLCEVVKAAIAAKRLRATYVGP
ncbi:MAG TPA: LysR family transcriptional regulator [Variovorax sp.]|nr:LysR family transcriptional regulator [Variovorax sp.]